MFQNRTISGFEESWELLSGTCVSKSSGRPSSFYAMLLMDGDSMGRLLSDARASLGDEGERQVTRALGQFANKVSPTVSGYDGVTVTAVAMTCLRCCPWDRLLACAPGPLEIVPRLLCPGVSEDIR